MDEAKREKEEKERLEREREEQEKIDAERELQRMLEEQQRIAVLEQQQLESMVNGDVSNDNDISLEAAAVIDEIMKESEITVSSLR